MTDKLKEKFKEEIKDLPKEMQDAVNAFDWGSATEEIGKQLSLNEGEINNLQTEVALVLMGLEYGEAFASNIGTEVGVTQEEAKKITEEIDQKVFKPIYEKLSENVKSELKNKKIKWNQNVDFVLSGGDYTVFLDPTDTTPAVDAPSPKVDTSFITKKDDLRTKLKI